MKKITTLVEPINSRQLVHVTFFISASVLMRKSACLGRFISHQHDGASASDVAAKTIQSQGPCGESQ